MDSIKLIKEINTLHTHVKATRSHIIRKLTRDNKFWADKAALNSSNRRAKRKAETSKAILNHLKKVPLSVLVEEVLRYEPIKDEASLQSAPVAYRSIARLVEDEKLDHHLKSLESQLGADSNSMIIDALKKKSAIKSSAIKKQRKERITIALERKQKRLQKELKKKDQSKQNTSVPQQLEGAEPDSAQETDEECNQTALVYNSHGSEDDSEELNEDQDETAESDDEEESDQQSKEIH
uniref:Uncharacterized protein n=1 Tax=Anopheles maculatus TaxID=74869 RepID=A0A182SMS1_9DIPT